MNDGHAVAYWSNGLRDTVKGHEEFESTRKLSVYRSEDELRSRELQRSEFLARVEREKVERQRVLHEITRENAKEKVHYRRAVTREIEHKARQQLTREEEEKDIILHRRKEFREQQRIEAERRAQEEAERKAALKRSIAEGKRAANEREHRDTQDGERARQALRDKWREYRGGPLPKVFGKKAENTFAAIRSNLEELVRPEMERIQAAVNAHQRADSPEVTRLSVTPRKSTTPRSARTLTKTATSP